METSGHKFKKVLNKEGDVGVIDLHIKVVDSRVDTQRVHPIPEGSLLPCLTWTTSTENHMTQRKRGLKESLGGSGGVRPSMALQSMSWFSGFLRAGYLLKRLATKARFSLGFPRTTSAGITNCLQPSRSACSSMASARCKSSFSCRGQH